MKSTRDSYSQHMQCGVGVIVSGDEGTTSTVWISCVRRSIWIRRGGCWFAAEFTPALAWYGAPAYLIHWSCCLQSLHRLIMS